MSFANMLHFFHVPAALSTKDMYESTHLRESPAIKASYTPKGEGQIVAGKPFIKAEAEEVLAALSKDDESLTLREPHETQKKIFMKAGSLKCFADGGPDSDQVLDNVDKKYTNEESL